MGADSEIDVARALEQALLEADLVPLSCGCSVRKLCTLPGPRRFMKLSAGRALVNCEYHTCLAADPRMRVPDLLASMVVPSWLRWYRIGAFRQPDEVWKEEFQEEWDTAWETLNPGSGPESGPPFGHRAIWSLPRGLMIFRDGTTSTNRQAP